ncbi:MAG TPA: hypothetical protein VK653_06605 [Xanthobacteraceae bacterium]|nr:hypothetical protein [Xanthobacteraceae bacterium]
MWICRTSEAPLALSSVVFNFVLLRGVVLAMSVLDDFVRMRRYRNRAAEFDELADIEGFSVVGRRYRTIACHYKELADREERLDKARMAERLELLSVKRQAVAAQAALAAESNAQVLILRAGQGLPQFSLRLSGPGLRWRLGGLRMIRCH